MSWWVWLASRASAAGTALVYGCAAKTNKAAGWNRGPDILSLPSGAALHIIQATVDMAVFEGIRETIAQRQLDLRAALPTAPAPVGILTERRVIQMALGQTAVPTRRLYPRENLEDVVGAAAVDLDIVVETISSRLGLPVTSEFPRLGTFEIFNLRPWADASVPVVLESQAGSERANGAGNGLAIVRTQAFAQNQHYAQVTCRCGGEVICEELLVLPPGQLRSREIMPPDAPDDVAFRLFNATGTLIHREEFTYLREIHLGMAVGGRTIEIDDDFTHRARAVHAADAASVASVRGHSTQRSRVLNARQVQPWRSHTNAVRDLLTRHRPAESYDRWFERGISEEVGVVVHFDHLLSSARVKAAILVDPYFGRDALQRVVLRMQSRDVALTIVTSLLGIDPDTGTTAANVASDLEQALNRARLFINPALRVINLVDGPRQAFHDRYLLIRPHEGIPQVYLLSNSLNKMAGNWPFCMSRLTGEAATRATQYIEGLAHGRDITNTTKPTITLVWPPNAPGS
jgi:hypothetical protein